MNYIDSEKLIAEIERRWKYDQGFKTDEETMAYQQCCDDILSFIGSLQQEQPDVDLEKEIELVKGDYEQVSVEWNKDFDYIARHFFELGRLNTRKEETE